MVECGGLENPAAPTVNPVLLCKLANTSAQNSAHKWLHRGYIVCNGLCSQRNGYAARKEKSWSCWDRQVNKRRIAPQ